MNVGGVDEAVVIGAALSISSPAFVLQVCKPCFNFHLPFSLQDNNGFVEIRENYAMPSMKSDL